MLQAKAEILQLEGIQAAATRQAAAEKVEELERICASTRLAVPDLPEGAAQVLAADGPAPPGQVRPALAAQFVGLLLLLCMDQRTC